MGWIELCLLFLIGLHCHNGVQQYFLAGCHLGLMEGDRHATFHLIFAKQRQTLYKLKGINYLEMP